MVILQQCKSLINIIICCQFKENKINIYNSLKCNLWLSCWPSFEQIALNVCCHTFSCSHSIRLEFIAKVQLLNTDIIRSYNDQRQTLWNKVCIKLKCFTSPSQLFDLPKSSEFTDPWCSHVPARQERCRRSTRPCCGTRRGWTGCDIYLARSSGSCTACSWTSRSKSDSLQHTAAEKEPVSGFV